MSECVKMKSDKYSLRNSPPYPANKCKTMKKKGNDGNYYSSEPDKNGVYKWVKLNKNKAAKSYIRDGTAGKSVKEWSR